MARFNEPNTPLPKYYTTPSTSQTDNGTIPLGVQDAAAAPDDTNDPNWDPKSKGIKKRRGSGNKRQRHTRTSHSEGPKTKKQKKFQKARHEGVPMVPTEAEAGTNFRTSTARMCRGTPDEDIQGVPVETGQPRNSSPRTPSTLSKSKQGSKKFCVVCRDLCPDYHYWNENCPGYPESRCIKCRISGIMGPKFERLNSSATPPAAKIDSLNELKNRTVQLVEDWWIHVGDRCHVEVIRFDDYHELLQWAEDFGNDAIPNPIPNFTYRAPQANMTTTSAERRPETFSSGPINPNIVQGTKDDDDPFSLYGVSDNDADSEEEEHNGNNLTSETGAEPRATEEPHVSRDDLSSRSATASLNGDGEVKDELQEVQHPTPASLPLPPPGNSQNTSSVTAPSSSISSQIPLCISVEATGQTETPPITPEAPRKSGNDLYQHSISAPIPNIHYTNTSPNAQQEAAQGADIAVATQHIADDGHGQMLRNFKNFIALAYELEIALSNLTPEQLAFMEHSYRLQTRFDCERITPELIEEIKCFLKGCKKARSV